MARVHGQAYIKQSVILNYQVCHDKTPQNIRWMLHPHTLPAAAGQCYSYIIAADQTDGQLTMCDIVWISPVTQFVVGETPFLVARITQVLYCPKTIQQ